MFMRFAYMDIHKGQIVQEKINKYRNTSGVSLTQIAKKAGYKHAMPYRHFKDPYLPSHIILRYGKAIGYDFSEDIPDLQNENILEDPEEPYGSTKSLEDCMSERDMWKDKYIELLEKHNAMLNEHLERGKK